MMMTASTAMNPDPKFMAMILIWAVEWLLNMRLYRYDRGIAAHPNSHISKNTAPVLSVVETKIEADSVE